MSFNTAFALPKMKRTCGVFRRFRYYMDNLSAEPG